jgi:V/A-type H+-transporting ATPase subunit C
MADNESSVKYAFISAMLRARESVMVNQEKIDRMIDARTYNDAAAMLDENGYPDLRGLSSDELFKKLNEHRNEIYNYLASLDASRDALDFFRVKFDYHNVKAAVKSEAFNLPVTSLMYDCGRIKIDKMRDALEQRDLSGLPGKMRETIEESRAVLARTGDPQLSDICADKAYFDERLEIAQRLDDKFVTDYTRLNIDTVNLRTVVRAQRMNRNAEFVKAAVIPGGTVSASSIQNTSATIEDVAPMYETTLLRRAAELGLAAVDSGSMSDFEIECDETAARYMKGSSTACFGPSPTIAYLFALENELASIRVVLGGILSGLSRDVIRERMRTTYV